MWKYSLRNCFGQCLLHVTPALSPISWALLVPLFTQAFLSTAVISSPHYSFARCHGSKPASALDRYQCLCHLQQQGMSLFPPLTLDLLPTTLHQSCNNNLRLTLTLQTSQNYLTVKRVTQKNHPPDKHSMTGNVIANGFSPVQQNYFEHLVWTPGILTNLLRITKLWSRSFLCKYCDARTDLQEPLCSCYFLYNITGREQKYLLSPLWYSKCARKAVLFSLHPLIKTEWNGKDFY